MIAYIVRFLKRLGVLVPGLLMVYVAVFNVFPRVERYVSYDPLAIFATYIITAYFLIPSLLRVIRLLLPPTHIPLYCTTPDGFASDPVNIGILGSKAELTKAMTAAGWFVADKRTPKTVFKMVVSMVVRQPYPTAPFSTLYLFGRKQDIGFELPVDANPRHRHHVRFWAASHTGDPRHLDHVSFWNGFHREDYLTGRVLWVGAASLDTGIGIIRHNAQLTHSIHPDTNAERELIATQLHQAGRVKKTRTVQVGKPFTLRNRVLNGYLRTDGSIHIIEV